MSDAVDDLLPQESTHQNGCYRPPGFHGPLPNGGIGSLFLRFLGRRFDLALHFFAQVLHRVHCFVLVLLEFVLVHRHSDVRAVAVAGR